MYDSPKNFSVLVITETPTDANPLANEPNFPVIFTESFTMGFSFEACEMGVREFHWEVWSLLQSLGLPINTEILEEIRDLLTHFSPEEAGGILECIRDGAGGDLWWQILDFLGIDLPKFGDQYLEAEMQEEREIYRAIAWWQNYYQRR